jgi:2-polyprenyl-6-methoxyphenol hydroxylase-like FAD-dependent oxidoreductase
MRILVSGGGVAGLTLAYWLDRAGHVPVVVERSAQGRTGGYGFDFAGAAYDASAWMGILDDLADRQIPADSLVWVDRAGRPFARLPRTLIERVTGRPYLGLMHYTLEDALIRAVEGRVEIRYGQSIQALTPEPDRVTVAFADGQHESFDLVVGADGVHSTTRRLAFGPEPPYARYLGYRLACYPISDEYDLGRVRAHHGEPGRQLVVYPTGRPGELIALFLFRAPDGEVPRPQRLAVLRSAFGDLGWIAPSVLAQAPDPERIFMDTLTQIDLPTWHRGRVALVGDAAGCMTLVSGQGVSMAMAGAFVLAGALSSHADPTVAFAHYQQRIRPEVARRQRAARRSVRGLVPVSRGGLAVQRRVLPLLLRDSLAPLLRRQFNLTSVLADEPGRS